MFNRVWAAALEEEAALQTAALMEGIRRVAEAYRVRGFLLADLAIAETYGGSPA